MIQTLMAVAGWFVAGVAVIIGIAVVCAIIRTGQIRRSGMPMTPDGSTDEESKENGGEF